MRTRVALTVAAPVAALALVLLGNTAARQGGEKPAPKSSAASPARQTARAAETAKTSGGALDEKTISFDQANAAIQAAMKKAQAIGIKEDIAVVDAGGNLKAFARMDNAWLGSIEIAIRKAKTARFLDMPTADLAKKAEPGQPLYGIQTIEPTVIFAGGVPIKVADGAIIGAIGCSGSTPDNDNQAANAGAQGVH